MPSTRLQDPLLFRITDGTTTWRYVIAKRKGGNRAWRRSKVSVQPGQGELVKTWDSWHSGMGWSRDGTRNSEYAAPVYESSGIISGGCTATHQGFIYPRLASSTISIPSSIQTAAGGTTNQMLEIGDYIYSFSANLSDAICVTKIDPSKGLVIYARAFSDWPSPAGQPAEFGGYAYVPSGGGVFKELTTIVGNLTAAWYYDGTNYTNNTSAAITAGGTAFTILADHTDDIFYFGAATQFDGVYFDIETAAGSALTMDWEYWNGAAWTDMVSETDGTTGLTVKGWVTWNSAAQTGWAAATPSATGMGGSPPDNTSRYWVRVKTTTATPWTAPTASWLPISDVWTDGPATRTAWHMCTAGKLLWRAGDASATSKHYVINSCSAISSGGSGGPLTAGNWSDTADYVIGKPGRNINSLAELGRWLYVGKEEGLFGSDSEGNQTNALDFVRDLVSSLNCVQTIRWLGTLVTMAAKGTTLWQHTGASSRPIGIETMVTNTSSIKGGTYLALATVGRWLYILYQVGNYYHLLSGRPGEDDEPPIVWHHLASIATTIGCVLHPSSGVSTANVTLWYGKSTTDFYYLTLGPDGSPDPTDSGVSFSTGRLTLPAVDWGFPGTNKRGHMVEVTTGGTAGNVVVACAWDGGSSNTVGTVTTTGLTRLFWTAGSNDSGRRPQLSFSLPASATRIEKVTLYCLGLPRKEDAIECTLHLYDLADGARSREDQFDELDALVNAGVYTLYDPDDPEGTATFKVIIDSLEETKSEQIEKVSGQSYVDVLARVVKYA